MAFFDYIGFGVVSWNCYFIFEKETLPNMAKKLTKRQTEVPLTGAFGVLVVFMILLYVLERRHYDSLHEINEIAEMTIFTDPLTGSELNDQGDTQIYGGILQDMFEQDSRVPTDRGITPDSKSASTTVGKLVAVFITEDTPISLLGTESLNDNLFGALEWPIDTSRTDRITQTCQDGTWTLQHTGDYMSETFYPKNATLGYYKIDGKGLKRVSQQGKPIDDLQYDLSKTNFKERSGTKWVYDDENASETFCAATNRRVMHLASQISIPFTILAMHAGDGAMELYDYGDTERAIFKARPGILGRSQLFREEIGSVKRITHVLRMTCTGATLLFLCIAGISFFQAGLVAVLTAGVTIGCCDWWFWGLGNIYICVCLTLPMIFLLVIELIARTAFNRYTSKRRPVQQSASGKTSPAAMRKKKQQ